MSIASASWHQIIASCALTLGGAPLSDFQTMINATGGNAKWPAFYDGRYNVTSSAGVVSSWADARTGSFGPALVGTGTQQPSYSGADHSVFDGVNNVLQCASAQAAFSLSQPLSLVFVGIVFTSGSNGRGSAALNSDSGVPSANAMAIGPRANPDQSLTSWHTPSATTYDAGVACSDTIVRLTVQVNNGTASKGAVANHATQSSAVTANTSQSEFLAVGAFFQSPVVNIGANTVYALGVYAGDIIADGNVGTLMTWAAGNRSATAAS